MSKTYLASRAFRLAFFRSAFVAASLVFAWGCSLETPSSPVTPPPVASRLPLRLLVIDDPELAVVIQREWDARAEVPSSVRQMSSEEFLAEDRERLGADAVIYPSGLLGEMVERKLILPLEEAALNEAAFDRRDILQLTRLQEMTWGQRVYAVPLGSPQFTLFYRRDIFDKLNLAPPTTWSEYQQLAERLSDRQAFGEMVADSDKPWTAFAEPLADGWAGQWLLARAGAYARHRNQYSTLFDYRTMDPLIAGPPFVRALEELASAAKHGPSERLSPGEARRRLLEGQCAMAVSWPSRADDASPQLAAGLEDRIGVAELPGAREVYNFRTAAWEQRASDEDLQVTLLAVAGRLGSVTAECRQTQAALGLLFLLSGRELGADISAASKQTAPFRESQLGRESLWVDRALGAETARQYGAVVQAAQNRHSGFASVRIPGRTEYLAALDQAVRSVLTGEASAEAALQMAAERWQEITEARGRENQRQAYTRSLGLEP